MIRIKRGPCPDVLSTKGIECTARLTELPRSILGTIRFRSDIYGHKDVRVALDEMQKGKCAFCETIILPVAVGDIEHFRPKGGVVNEDTGKLLRPGYYWLAYEWSNLMLACPRCNGKGKKGSRFPLEEESSRARCAEDDIDAEGVLLIDPTTENPRDHIVFREFRAFARLNSKKGTATIALLGLDDEPLIEERKKTALIISALSGVTKDPIYPDAKRQRAAAVLSELVDENGQYLACLSDMKFIDPPSESP